MAEQPGSQKVGTWEQRYYDLRQVAMELWNSLNGVQFNDEEARGVIPAVKLVESELNRPWPPPTQPEATANAAPQPDPEVEGLAERMWLDFCDKGRDKTLLPPESDWRRLVGSVKEDWRTVARFVLAEQKKLRERNSKLELVLSAVNDMVWRLLQ